MGSTINDFEMNITGTDAVFKALRGAKNELIVATVPVMEMAVISLAARAKAKINTSRTHNLWRAKGGSRLVPRYNIKRMGPFWFQLSTPGGRVGKAQAMAEFTCNPTTNQGAALVSSLNSTYGRKGGSGGGRILWATRDEMDASIASSIKRAVDAAAAEIERQAGGN